MNRSLLALFTLAAAGVYSGPKQQCSNPLVYPTPGEWHFTVGVENGVEHASSPTLSATDAPSAVIYETTNYKFGSTQTVGYGSWFYVQSRLSYSAGYSTGPYAGEIQTFENDFFDGDWTLVLPFHLSTRQRVTLGPQLGVAYMSHLHRNRVPIGGGFPTKSKVTYTAPLAGLVFGLQPTNAFAMRVGLNLQFPTGTFSTTVNSVTSSMKLVRRRHSLNAYVNLMYQLSKHLAVTGTVEHKSYSVQGSNVNEVLLASNAFRTSGTIGVNWVF